MGIRKIKRALSYSVYWIRKGPYGERRVDSMIKRKRKRYEKRKESARYRHNTWIGEDGQLWQKCDWQGDCHYPCNGDC